MELKSIPASLQMNQSSPKDQLNVFLKVFLQWVDSQRVVEGAIMVGSHARGEARQDSDIDLVLLCTEYESYLQDLGWTNDFGKPVSVLLEDYCKLTSVRAFLLRGPGSRVWLHSTRLAGSATGCRNSGSPAGWISNCL